MPLDFHLTSAKASDSKHFETRLGQEAEVTRRAVITDKGHDAKANRDAARGGGSIPVIPRRDNARDRARFFPKRLYKLRARIEIPIGKAKRFKRLAMRCEKTARNYAAVVALVFGFILVQSVHTD